MWWSLRGLISSDLKLDCRFAFKRLPGRAVPPITSARSREMSSREFMDGRWEFLRCACSAWLKVARAITRANCVPTWCN
jgi:hypothetical protein